MSWHLYIYCGKFLMVTLGRSERLDQNVLWTVLCLALDPSLWNCLLQTHWAKLVLRTASPVPEQTTFTLWSFCPLKQHLPWVTSKTQCRSQSCGLWGWQKCSCSCWILLANPSSAGLVADARGSWFLGYTHCLPLLPRVSCLAPGCSKLTLQWRHFAGTKSSLRKVQRTDSPRMLSHPQDPESSWQGFRAEERKRFKWDWGGRGLELPSLLLLLRMQVPSDSRPGKPGAFFLLCGSRRKGTPRKVRSNFVCLFRGQTSGLKPVRDAFIAPSPVAVSTLLLQWYSFAKNRHEALWARTWGTQTESRSAVSLDARGMRLQDQSCRVSGQLGRGPEGLDLHPFI